MAMYVALVPLQAGTQQYYIGVQSLSQPQIYVHTLNLWIGYYLELYKIGEYNSQY